MKKIHGKYFLSCFLGIVLATIILSGCSQKVVNEDAASSIALSMKVTEPGLMQLVNEFRLIVTALDMKRIDTPLTLQGRYIVGKVTVPAGDNRRFTVLALNAASQDTIYRGDTIANVSPGATINLPINLYSQVPLIKLSPRFQPVRSDTTFSLDVRVGKIHNLYGISFRILFESYLIRPESIQVNPNLIRVDHIDLDSGFYAIGLSETDTTKLLVDTGGNATLATVYFQSLYPEINNDTTTLTINVTELRRPDGSFIPIGSVYTDEALVEVGQSSNPVVTFPDSVLEDAVRRAIPKPEGDIFLSDVQTIDTLDASCSDSLMISDLTGLSYLSNLEFLVLDNNEISDISELSNLTNLKMLFLAYNYQVQDITPLSGLPNLNQLDLTYNQVMDIQPLVLNNGIDSGDVVFLTGNPLSDTTQVDYLCVRQVAVFLEPGIDWCQGF